MILSRRVSLNSVYLDELDDRIVISGIEIGDGRENIASVDTAAGFGQRVTSSKRVSLDVVIKFRLLQRSRKEAWMRERSRLLEMVNAWAAPGGNLRVNYKSGRRLNVILAQAPGEGSLWDYTKEFQLVFRAYTIPYWEDNTASSVQTGGGSSSGSKAVEITGSAPTQCNVELANTSGAKIDECTVTIGDSKMTFENLGLAGHETLVIDHSNGLLRLRIRNAGGTHRSVMNKRTTGSANDFRLDPGIYTGSFSAKRACQMTISWRNRYL